MLPVDQQQYPAACSVINFIPTLTRVILEPEEPMVSCLPSRVSVSAKQFQLASSRRNFSHTLPVF